MQTSIPTIVKILRPGRRSLLTAIVGLGCMLGFGSAVRAQTTPPLNFGNNYFVTGDYVVAGVAVRGLGDSTGFAKGTITMPDANTVPSTGVPPGAAVVAAFLYWQTVESSSTAFVGQTGYFRPVFAGGPATGYQVTAAVLGNPNSPVSWSAGGCSGSSQGSKTIRTYRANVLPLLPVDANGNVQANGTYEVRLADSGSNGGGAPLTLGASLVIIYRILDPNVPLNDIVIYDGAFAPSNNAATMSLTLQGLYQAGTPANASAPISKLTHIVGNGQDNKSETVNLNGVTMPSLYGALPPFPGYYNSNGTTFDGSWDNPTWIANNYQPVGTAMLPNASSAITNVLPSASNSGCVSWGAVIVSTTVKDSDNDGLVDIWESNHGYCDASAIQSDGSCASGGWVDLTGADPAKKDIFVEMDYLCSIVNPDGTCDTTNGYSFLPSSDAQNKMIAAFAAKNISLHLIPTNAIQETTCTDNLSASPPTFCPFPNQPGVVGWKAGFEFLKYQPMNYPDELSCETQTPPGGTAGSGPACIRRFQHGKKDSYHYALFGHALGAANWSLVGGNLTSVSESGNTVTFTTTSDPSFNATTNPSGLVANDNVSGNGRVTVSDVLSNLCLNGTFYVTGVNSTSFTIQVPPNTACPASANYTLGTDPSLSVTSGKAGTGSGFSDLGGEDTLVTLGLWGPDGLTVNSQSGTFMHEVGHTLGLAHGGIYYGASDFPSPGNTLPTAEPNCKPNYQSVMSYRFQVDLLDNGKLDYSEEKVVPQPAATPPLLNELSLLGVTGLTPDGGANPLRYCTLPGVTTYYCNTKWYTSSPPVVGTAATFHCDGTPITDGAQMYSVEGVTNPLSPAWANNQDINFNGNLDASLRGYNDWVHVDLRQIGATGSLGLGGGQLALGGGQFGLGGGQFGLGGGQFGLGGGQFGLGGGQFGLGGGQFGLGGEGHGEVSFRTVNSYVRPPRNLQATVLKSPNRIQLTWNRSSFGQVAFYNIYRGAGTSPVPPFYAQVPGGDQSQTTTHTFTDTSVSCGATYFYFVTAQLSDGRESVPSNTVTVVKCVVQ